MELTGAANLGPHDQMNILYLNYKD